MRYQGTLFDESNPAPKNGDARQPVEDFAADFLHLSQARPPKLWAIFLPHAESYMNIPGYSDVPKKTGLRGNYTAEGATRLFITGQMPTQGYRIWRGLKAWIDTHGGITKYVCRVPNLEFEGNLLVPSHPLHEQARESALAEEIAKMRGDSDDYHKYINLAQYIMCGQRKGKESKVERPGKAL